MNIRNTPRLVVTPGEPGGIGPDLCLKMALRPLPYQWVVAADPSLMRARAKELGLDIDVRIWSESTPIEPHQAGGLWIWPVEQVRSVTSGQALAENGVYVLETLRHATRACQRGQFHALVTGPIQKSSINEAGVAFTGHTEFLAELTNSPQPVMMLATEGLRVALVTTHVPISQVSGLIKQERVMRVLRILHRELRIHFGIDQPRILVSGLNPHAGENGHCGLEDQREIAPVIKQLVKEGMSLQGPLPADTLFTPRYLDEADAVLAMYHDQGLPVLKYKGFGQAINVTLGLPIIRTSVDHGTALNLAGTGMADHRSLALAMQTAVDMAKMHLKKQSIISA